MSPDERLDYVFSRWAGVLHRLSDRDSDAATANPEGASVMTREPLSLHTYYHLLIAESFLLGAVAGWILSRAL